MPRAGSVCDESVLRVPKATSARSEALIRAGSICAIIFVVSPSSRLGPTTGWLGGGGGWSSSLSAPDAYAPPASSTTVATTAVAVVRPLMVPSLVLGRAALDPPADQWSTGKLPDKWARVKQSGPPSTWRDEKARDRSRAGCGHAPGIAAARPGRSSSIAFSGGVMQHPVRAAASTVAALMALTCGAGP